MRLFLFLICLVLSTALLATPKEKSAKKQQNVTKKKEEAKDEQKEEKPPKIGNFTLEASQQPGPLLSFGDNIIDKNQKRLILFADYYKGHNKITSDIVPSFLYGITDNFSVFFNVPIAMYCDDNNHSDGLEDIFLQLEYAYYNKSTKVYQEQATFVAYFTMPTGSVKKNPNTGLGSCASFLGATFNKTYVDWLFFSSLGALFPTSLNHTKYGNQYLYQMGFGKNICYIKSKQIFAGVIEITGAYTDKNTIQGTQDPNSGGNVIYVTPSLWLSSQKLNIQFGAGLPFTQNLYGEQNCGSYLLAMNFGITI